MAAKEGTEKRARQRGFKRQTANAHGTEGSEKRKSRRREGGREGGVRGETGSIRPKVLSSADTRGKHKGRQRRLWRSSKCTRVSQRDEHHCDTCTNSRGRGDGKRDDSVDVSHTRTHTHTPCTSPGPHPRSLLLSLEELGVCQRPETGALRPWRWGKRRHGRLTYRRNVHARRHLGQVALG